MFQETIEEWRQNWRELRADTSRLTVVAFWIALTLVIVIVLAMTAPIDLLLGEGKEEFALNLHGLAAGIYLVAGTMVLFLSWRLFTGQLKAFGDLKLLTVISLILAFITNVWGTWVYIFYRAPDGPRAYFRDPATGLTEIHGVFFEFKEFMGWFTVPLLIAGAYILWKYGRQVMQDKQLRTLVATAIGLSWLYLVITMILGAGVTRLASVGNVPPLPGG